MYHFYTNQKKAEVVLLISDKKDTSDVMKPKKISNLKPNFKMY